METGTPPPFAGGVCPFENLGPCVAIGTARPSSKKLPYLTPPHLPPQKKKKKKKKINRASHAVPAAPVAKPTPTCRPHPQPPGVSFRLTLASPGCGRTPIGSLRASPAVLSRRPPEQRGGGTPPPCGPRPRPSASLRTASAPCLPARVPLSPLPKKKKKEKKKQKKKN